MRRLSLILATSTLLMAPASVMAKSQGFASTVSNPISTPVQIEVVLSESLEHRADNLPKDIRKRGGTRSLRSGFSGNGFYGERELSSLVEEVREELTDDLSKKGIEVVESAPTVLTVTLEDVKNNRPTFEQLARQPALSFNSFGIGGAELSAVLATASGEELGTMNYRWFESFNDPFFAQNTGIWTDANRAISRFSKRAAKELSEG